MKEFCKCNNLIPCVKFLPNDFTFTWQRSNSNSLIDHFAISHNYNKHCSNLVILDDNALEEVNLSDHSALSISQSA